MSDWQLVEGVLSLQEAKGPIPSITKTWVWSGCVLDTGSELTMILKDPKKYYGPPVKLGAYGGQVIMELWLMSDSQ